MRKANRKAGRRAVPQRVARLYHFERQTVEQIEFLSTVFGGKEKGIAAAVNIASSVLRGEKADLQISIK